MVIDEFYQCCMSCDFGKQRNKITFRFGTKKKKMNEDVVGEAAKAGVSYAWRPCPSSIIPNKKM